MMTQDPNNYWEQLERLEKLIRASEMKAGVIFSFHSLILGLFVDRIDFIKPLLTENVVFLVLTCLWLLFVLISIFYCFKCFIPQMELKYEPNVFFFMDAVKAFGSAEEFSKKLMEVCATEEELYTQLSEQIHVESKIIDEKFKSVKKSLQCFGISFIIVMLTMVVWIIQIII